MKSLLKLFLFSLFAFAVNNSFSQIEIDWEDVDSVDAYIILSQIDEVIADESKLDDVTLSFDELMGLFPDSLVKTLSKEEKAEARIEYQEFKAMAAEAFSELRAYSKSNKGEIYITGETDEGGIHAFEVEYSLWSNEDESDGAEVDFIFFKKDNKIYFVYAEAY